jgi:hypothetical protein
MSATSTRNDPASPPAVIFPTAMTLSASPLNSVLAPSWFTDTTASAESLPAKRTK